MQIVCTVSNDLSHDQRMHRICTSLCQAGHQVTLVGRELPNSLPLPERPFQQVRLSCRFHGGKRFYVEFNYRLWRYLRSQKMDVINAVDLDTLLPASLVSWQNNRICVYDAHEYYTETPEVVRRPLVRWVWRGLARWLIPRVKFAYTVGQALATELEKRYRVPFAVIRNVPWSRPIEKSAPLHPRVLLYQGMLNEARGLETAILAMRQLPHHQLWLVGHGDIQPQLEAMSRRYGLEARIRFWGFVPPQQLSSFTHQAFLGLNLLENRGLSYYYSLANKTFDYIQAGVPAIHMDFPEYRRLQDTYGTGLLLATLDPQQLVQIVRRITDDPAKYQQLVQNCRTAADILHWEKEEEALLAFWDRVVKAAQVEV